MSVVIGQIDPVPRPPSRWQRLRAALADPWQRRDAVQTAVGFVQAAVPVALLYADSVEDRVRASARAVRRRARRVQARWRRRHLRVVK